MKWEPWNVFNKDQKILPIKEPPCKTCKFWKPVQKFLENGMANGVICCQSIDMDHDFSCYFERTE